MASCKLSYVDEPVTRRASDLFGSHFGVTVPPDLISVPGRVNLIGEHIDYHNLPVLPMAIQRRIAVAFRARTDRSLRTISEGYGERRFALADSSSLQPGGDWGNYLLAAVRMVEARWPISRGIDAAIASDLPSAAGLSSSSALLTGFALALLHVNEIHPTVEELMEVLPDGEQFVGTRGGGMDHAAVLAAKAGCALLIHFAPFRFTAIPIPSDWAFLVAHSLTLAEKSGAARVEYNARRVAASDALRKLGFGSYRDAVTGGKLSDLSAEERGAFLHCVEEAQRVELAVLALRANDIQAFGKLLSASHVSLRDQLCVSNAALDELVDSAREAGALGARLTGAGFGGCAIILCRMPDRDRIRKSVIEAFYARRPGFDPAQHFLFAEPSAGALSA